MANSLTPPRAAATLRLVAPCVLVAAFASIPLLFIVYYAYDAGWAQVRALVWRPLIGELLVNTLSLCALAAGACVALGVLLAWLTERSSLPCRRLWAAVLSAPLAVPAFVNSYAWISIFPRLDGLVAAVCVTTLSYYPFVFLPAAAALRGLDPTLEESARALGLGPVRVFLRVVVPQLRVAVLGGALLVSLHLLAEYGAIEQLRYPTFTTAIIAQYESTFASTAATMLAGVLVLCCLVFLTFEVLLRGRSRYAAIGSGAARRPVRTQLRWATGPSILALGAVAALALGVPGYSIAKWLVFDGGAAWNGEALLDALVSTVTMAAMAAMAAVVLAFPVAWAAVRNRSALSTALERSTYLASSVPGVVVGLSLVTASIRYARPLYQTTTLVVAAYVMLFLPRAMVSLRSAVSQARPELEEASASLGQSWAATFRRVTLPLAAPGIAAGLALVFIAVTTELTATLLLAPTGTHTLATQFWAASSEIDYPGAAPYAAAMVLISAPATYLLMRQAGREGAR